MTTADQKIGGWLAALASGDPTPGGGAAAGLMAAQGAALISMVANLTIGKKGFEAHEQTMRVCLDTAETARREALAAADDDAIAFDTVMAAYRLPKDTEDQKAARSLAIQQATADAAGPPLRIAQIASRIIEQAHQISLGANPNVLSDVAVAAQCARAALDAAFINVEINLAALKDQTRRDELTLALELLRPNMQTADLVIGDVRERIAK